MISATTCVEIILRRRSEMETADDGVHLLHARNILRLSHRVDDADMAARADYDETLILHIKAGRVLMDVLVGHDLPLQLRGRVVACIAAETVLNLANSTNVLGSTFSMLARLILPVVKA